MEKFIALIFLVPVLLWYDFQPYQAQINGEKQMYVSNVVHTALSQGKLKGYFLPTELVNLQTQVANKLGYPSSTVIVTGTTTPQTRGGLVTLTISVPTHLQFLNLYGSSDSAQIVGSETAMSEKLQ